MNLDNRFTTGTTACITGAIMEKTDTACLISATKEASKLYFDRVIH
jgi:hypothetical protein